MVSYLVLYRIHSQKGELQTVDSKNIEIAKEPEAANESNSALGKLKLISFRSSKAEKVGFFRLIEKETGEPMDVDPKPVAVENASAPINVSMAKSGEKHIDGTHTFWRRHFYVRELNP
jgi:hypothetical protein